MELIQVVDSFLSDDDLKRINMIIDSKTWTFGHQSTPTNINISPFWTVDLIKEPFFTEYLKCKIEEHLHIKTILNMVYLNGQTYGQNGTFHQDDPRENAYTFCLYLNGDENTDGSIIIKIPGDKRMIAVEPIHNRAIYFPSNYFHKGDAFNRFHPGLRVCVAWKFNLLF